MYIEAFSGAALFVLVLEFPPSQKKLSFRQKNSYMIYKLSREYCMYKKSWPILYGKLL